MTQLKCALQATALLMVDGLETAYRWSLGTRIMDEEALKKILTQLPKEVSSILEMMRNKISILENDKVLLQQENSILLRNQDMLMQAHKELHLENMSLKENLQRRD
jgi:glycerate-2-kinase